MCDDCQAYAYWLERADDILDENGGTAVFQMTPAQLKLVEGREHLRCVRLSDKGLMRWYAGCCNTPIGNTLASAKMPFIGVFHLVMDHARDGRTAEEALGPVRARVQARWGRGELPADAHPRAPLGLILRSVRLLLRGWLRGGHAPSPLFDPLTGKPVAEPTVLTPEARERLRASCGPRRPTMR